MIALCPNPFRDIGLKLTLMTADMLNKAGFTTVICPVYSDDASEVLPVGIEYSDLSTIENTCSLAVVIGGDGTILSVVRALGGGHLPVLGSSNPTGFIGPNNNVCLPRSAISSIGIHPSKTFISNS